MSELLYLPAPKQSDSSKKRFSKRSLFAFGITSVLVAVLLIVFGSQQKEILANLTLTDLQLSLSTSLEAIKEAQSIVLDKNLSPVKILVEYRGTEQESPHRIHTTLQELGFEYSLNESFFEDQRLENATPFFQDGLLRGSAENISDSTVAQLSIDYNKWDLFLNGLKPMVEKPALRPQLTWNEDQGWILEEGQKGIELHSRQSKKALNAFGRELLEGNLPSLLVLETRAAQPNLSMEEREELASTYKQILAVVDRPLLLKLAGEEYLLDLMSEEDFILLTDSGAELNEEKVKGVLQEITAVFNRPTNTIRIIGKEEVRPGVFKAVTEGKYEEGRRLDVDILYDQILDAIASEEQAEESEELEGEESESVRVVEGQVFETPLKVYSELDEAEFELLSVGYSEYSKGNAPNRVHNIETALGRIDNSLIPPGEKISFNRLNGKINNDFLVGYAIFGPVAKPSLGGGVCQVSTTFYRSMLNLGTPITMRQNHSWDLSYYREGGYGLDATIFPSVGLDVKSINDLDSHLFIYSYTRPETEEAFVLVYGKGDGRQVTLEPEEEYIPFYGAKTLKWTQTIEMPDGEVITNDIVSRYRM